METVVIGKSVFGTILSIVLLTVARATLQDWATVGTILAAVATFGYTMYKWGKEILRDYRTGKKKIPFRKRK